MKCDVILAGVGGQGVLSVAAIIAQAAVAEGLQVRQSEVHGMAQRGGAVLAHLRISDGEIFSDLVPRGSAELILSMEPLESLRYVEWLSPCQADGRLKSGSQGGGVLVTAAEALVNIPNYPDISCIMETIKMIPLHHVIEAGALAKQAGLARAVNMVMVGAASAFLPVGTENLNKAIRQMFASKDSAIIDANIHAFTLGRNAVK